MGKILNISVIPDENELKYQNNDKNGNIISALTVYDKIYGIKDNEAHKKIDVLEEKISNIETLLEVLNKTISKIVDLNLNKV